MPSPLNRSTSISLLSQTDSLHRGPSLDAASRTFSPTDHESTYRVRAPPWATPRRPFIFPFHVSASSAACFRVVSPISVLCSQICSWTRRNRRREFVRRQKHALRSRPWQEVFRQRGRSIIYERRPKRSASSAPSLANATASSGVTSCP